MQSRSRSQHPRSLMRSAQQQQAEEGDEALELTRENGLFGRALQQQPSSRCFDAILAPFRVSE